MTTTTPFVLITGVAGFIGSNLARAFAHTGYRVVGCDRMGSDQRWRNLRDVPLHDLIRPEALPAWLAAEGDSVGLVVHMGAISTTTETDIDAILRDNIRFSLDLWTWCCGTNVRFLYASSASTYGDGAVGFVDDESPEAMARLSPMNAYGWSKHVVDQRILSDHRRGNTIQTGWAGLKFFNVYGPGEDHKGAMRSVVNKIIPVVQSGQQVELFRSYRLDYADGEQKRDFVFIDDIVDVLLWLAQVNPPVTGLFNLGTGQARSWNDLARAVFTACGMPERITYVEMPEEVRSHYQYFTEAPMDRLRTAGWNRPFTTLEEGVRRYVARTAHSG
jgi:ADP-L-glycero-D-manno-heptose 6-epimerase